MLLITCPFGLSSILWKEFKILWYHPQDTFPTWTFVQGDKSTIYDINLRSRIANKVYLQIWKLLDIKTFDQLFDFVNSLDYLQYFQPWQKIAISASSQNSQLSSIPSIQSIWQKAIIKKLDSGCKLSWQDRNDKSDWGRQNSLEIFIFLQNNICSVFLNTSWISLHNRWYRKQTVEAPIKENVAAWLILLSWRKFKEKLCDPFCWSWTILIEAAMIAKNIAPWLHRSFDFQNFPDFDLELFEQIKQDCESKIFKDRKYEISGSDIDSATIDMAIQNAKNAGVYDTIKFETKDFFSITDMSWHMVSNPPYGKRLQDFDLSKIYTHIDKLFSTWNLTWWIITSYEWFQDMIDKPAWQIVRSKYSSKTIFNWADKCAFWKKA